MFKSKARSVPINEPNNARAVTWAFQMAAISQALQASARSAYRDLLRASASTFSGKDILWTVNHLLIYFFKVMTLY
jgi:hypothetical protein